MSLGNQVYGQLPNYAQSLGNIGTNIASETAGKLPADVVTQIAQNAAERGIATGSPGSNNSNAALLRALGLTSLNLTNMGESNLTSLLPHLPGAGIYQNPAFYPTSGQGYEAQVQNNLNAAAPDPAAAAEASLRAAGAGYGAGRGSGGGGLPPTPNDRPGASGPPAGVNIPGVTSPLYGGGGGALDIAQQVMRDHASTVNGGGNYDTEEDPFVSDESYGSQPASENYYPDFEEAA